MRQRNKMPTYDFECLDCKIVFEEISSFDETGEYPSVVCPKCGSKNKNKLASCANFNFSNPVGTDRWNNGSTGHDYRFKHNIPKVKAEREMAEALSHMGKTPYGKNNEKDLQLGEGIHDPETRSGLS